MLSSTSNCETKTKKIARTQNNSSLNRKLRIPLLITANPTQKIPQHTSWNKPDDSPTKLARDEMTFKAVFISNQVAYSIPKFRIIMLLYLFIVKIILCPTHSL
ncbi:hypothetical protein CEXT_336291 [Caerostris extrusa]|uniref:Uncharacterized protein n=1 Tax=Caerostris extrusa TaxID=172846 RepID=A0AAV4UYR0_CAEEX|nr:hypothetical protein CEXT_336291 [Caerostris extrusa]